MKVFILLALGCLPIVSAQRRFYQTPNLVPAESVTTGGEHLRTFVELRDHLKLLENFNFLPGGSMRSSSGVRRIRLTQTFNGVPIREATLQASQDDNGFYTGVVSGFSPTIPSSFDTSASQKPQKLRRALVDYINDNDSQVPDRKVKVKELENFNYQKQIHIDDNGNPVLVYFVSALVDRGLTDGAYIRYPRVMFKADDLTPIKGVLSVEKCHADTSCPRATGGNAKSGPIAYGPKCRQVCLNASVKKGNKCVLGNDMVRVKSANFAWKREDATPVSFDCDVGLDSSKGAAADAYYYAQIFYDVLQEWGRLRRTHREPHTLFVDFGDDYSNSFWDGQSTTFGNGNERTYPFAVPEIIGHEMCHALTDSFGNLVFDQETEAVDEAFSDICGKAVSYYLKGSNAGWAYAFDLLKHPTKALRYFDDPTRDGSTIAHMSQFTTDLDGYTTIGIYLKAFYSIVQEQNVRFRDAFETFVYANKIYWNEETGFYDGACGVLRATSDLGLDKNAFRNGFEAVGINLNFCDLFGTEDHIVSSHSSSYGETRHAQISSSRFASYKVSSETSASSVRVSIFHAGDINTKMESSCAAGSFEVTHERSHVFSLSAGTTIVLSSDCDEITDVKVTFEFL